MDQVKRIMITLHATIIYSGRRTFAVDIPLDVNPHTFNTGILDGLADDARIAWDFSNEGFVDVSEHTIEEAVEPTAEAAYPIITLKP